MGATFVAEDWRQGFEKGKTKSKMFFEVGACSASTWIHPSVQHSRWEINSGKELVTSHEMKLRSIGISASKPYQYQIGVQIRNSLDNAKAKIAGWSFCPSACSQQVASWGPEGKLSVQMIKTQSRAWHDFTKSRIDNNCEFDWVWLNVIEHVWTKPSMTASEFWAQCPVCLRADCVSCQWILAPAASLEEISIYWHISGCLGYVVFLIIWDWAGHWFPNSKLS